MPWTTPRTSIIAVSWRERLPKSALIASSIAPRRSISAALNRFRSVRRFANDGAPSRRWAARCAARSSPKRSRSDWPVEVAFGSDMELLLK